MNGFHNPSELRRQIEAASTAMESIRRTQRALACSPALEGIRRAQADVRRIHEAITRPPALEAVRRAQEDIRRTCEAITRPRALEAVRRAHEGIHRMCEAITRPPALEAVRRAQEDIRRMFEAITRPPALEAVRRAQEDIRRMYEALARPPVLAGIRRTLEAWSTSSLALHRAIQAIRVDALDIRVGYAGDRLVAHAEKPRGRDQRGRRLRKVGQTATNWLGRLANRRKVRPPVGSSLRGFAEFVFSKKSYEQIYDPLISDLRFEYYEALDANRRWKARWVWARGCLSFLTAASDHAVASVGRRVARVWRIFQVGE